MSDMSLQILLRLRDRMTAPARQAGSAFRQMGQQISGAARSITSAANGAASGVRGIGAAAASAGRQVASFTHQLTTASRRHVAAMNRMNRNSRGNNAFPLVTARPRRA